MNFNKIFFTVALMNVNAGYGMVKSLADSAAQPAITHMLTAMDTPQGWAQFEVSMANERVGKQEIEKLTQALLKSRNIPWFVTKTLQHQAMMVYSASFSPDGRSVVTASLDRTARIWECGFTDQSVAIKLYLTQLLLQAKLSALHRRGPALRSGSLVHLYPIWNTLPRNIRNDLVRQFPRLNIRAAIEPTNYWPTIIAGGVGVAALGAAAYWLLRK